MGRINLNLDSIRSQRLLGNTNNEVAKSVERISSGLRINRAADDAAGLSISERLRTEVRGLNQAVRNGQDGLSLIQTAEGALTEVQSILQRMRELAVQGSNDTLNSVDRGAIKSELSSLISEIDRISNATKFNGIALLTGGSAIQFKIGSGALSTNESMTFTPVDTVSDTVGFGSATTFSGTFRAADPTNLDTAVTNVTTGSADARVTLSTLIASVDDALNDVSDHRATMGAQANRLEYTIRSLQVAAEAAAASQSRIRDADVAAEVSTFVSKQILQQAAISILGQANQAPALILQLLR